MVHFASQNTHRVADDPVVAAYHAAVVACSKRRDAASKRVVIGGLRVARFLKIGDPDDGTLRCIACGQIDDLPWHKRDLCFGMIGLLEDTTAAETGSVGMSPKGE